MYLYLMRHGIAVSADEPGVKSDNERQLATKGIKRLGRAACGLANLKIPFGSIVTSPARRARQTAEIVAQRLGLEAKVEEITALAPGSSVEGFMAALSVFRNEEHVLLVGHEPLLSEAASFLLVARRNANVKMRFRKAGLCCIELDKLPATRPGVLHWHLTARQLRLLGSKP
jgi:phosphohistidine phosphatase